MEYTVKKIAINGKFTKSLPSRVNKLYSYPVSFTYTNTNETLSATGVSVKNTTQGAIFKETVNNCDKILTPITYCTISGNLQVNASSNIGDHISVSSQLNFEDGSVAELKSEANVVI